MMQMISAHPTVDWAGLLPAVARHLLGEPTRIESGGDTWRYRSRGSLVVHVTGERRGTWHDFEAGTHGGTLALIQHVKHLHKADALRWLEAEGLIEPRTGARSTPHRPPIPSSSMAPPPGTAPKRSKTVLLAAEILAAAVDADDTPARAYLAARCTWPPFGIGPNLPLAVRWCAARDVSSSVRPAHCRRWPGGLSVWTRRHAPR